MPHLHCEDMGMCGNPSYVSQLLLFPVVTKAIYSEEVKNMHYVILYLE